MFKSYFPENIQGNAVMIFFPVQLKSFVHDFFFHFKSVFFPINIYDKVYSRKESFSLAKVKRKLSNQLYCSFKLQSQLKVNGA